MKTQSYNVQLINANDQILVNSIENCFMQLAEFTHEVHVKLGYCYLATLGLESATLKMQSTLLNFLQHHGVSVDKFHVTLTAAWLRAIWHFMQHSETMSSADKFIQLNPVLLNKNILLSHYSHDLLFSDQARTGYVHPDLNPFPQA